MKIVAKQNKEKRKNQTTKRKEIVGNKVKN